MYSRRNRDAGILPGTTLLITATAQVTIPKMLEEKGYNTGTEENSTFS
jgi:hypothetical protein